MDVKTVSIDSIKPYPNNPRLNDNAVDKVANSIKEFGFQQPIVVDKDGVVIVGHTRLKAAKKLGLKEVPVVYATNLNEEQVKAYRLADNKVGEESVWDNKKLLEELGGIDDSLFTGFTKSDYFKDVLEETDNEPVEDNEKGLQYSISFKTQNKELFEKVKMFVEESANLEA
jgi:parB-like protein|nr:MAG TPA: ParB protein [Caudoviricetes sp.]